MVVLEKMRTSLTSSGNVEYLLGESLVNTHIGETLTLKSSGKYSCLKCDKIFFKGGIQGHCPECSGSLASCDQCIVSPELCHFSEGTCREPLWGKNYCFIPHYVYLSLTSEIKVGVTRHTQVPTRWIDQGAVWAKPILKTKDRKSAGILEVALKEKFADRTQWQRMLKAGRSEEPAWPDIEEIGFWLSEKKLGVDFEIVKEKASEIVFPVESLPEKIKSLKLKVKGDEVSGVLKGVKGQYLIFDTGVFNVRSHSGLNVSIHWEKK